MDAKRPVGVARIKGDYLIDLCIPDYISSETLNKEVVKDGGQISPVVGMGN